MKKRILSILLCLCMVMALLPTTALAATSISNFEQLQAAFSNGGEYTLAANITVTEQLTLNSGITLTINGNGKTIQPEVTGLNEQGIVNADASDIPNIISNDGTLTLENLTIYGGNGRCIRNSDTLTMTGVSLERAHLTGTSTSAGAGVDIGKYGAGLYNYPSAEALLTNCNIRRNGCESSGGGFYNYRGTLILENCAIVENRNFGGTNGGGAGENSGSGATLYMNNCTVANNQSSEIGGGLNNYDGTAYIMNSTFTGNVTTASAAPKGGGIGCNGGTVYAVNSAFAFNYANGVASDIGIYYSSTNVYLYNCAYGAIVTSSGTTEGAARDTCKKLTGTVSDLFNGARTSGIVDKYGVENTETTFARPVITPYGNTYGVYPAESSALRSGGTKTYYNRDGFTVKMSYDNSSSTKIDLGNLGTATTVVTGPESSNRAGLIGAWPANFTIKPMYTVKVNPAEGGTVTGGSAQGNSYPKDTANIQITAVPSTGYAFSGWDVENEPDSITANPYTLPPLTKDVTLTPVFASAPTYTVTFKPNGGTGTMGNQTYTQGVAQALTANAFSKAGYTFSGWATTADGAVTYTNSQSITLTENTQLFAKWTPAALTGTAKITGTAKYGQTLTASLEGGNNTGALTFTWYRSDESNSISTGTSYQVQTADIGKTLTCKVTSSEQSGNITSNATATVEKADGPAAPSVTPVACTNGSNNDGKITGVTTAMEYSAASDFASKTACTGTEITNLTNGTYYVRMAETATHKAGAAAAVNVPAYSAPLTYSIELSPSGTQTFTAATVGYATAPDALTITVRNTGTGATGPLTVALTAGDTGAFEVSTSSISSITTTNGTDTFTIQPKTGLSAKDDPYTATVTVKNETNNISATFTVSFTVNPLGDLETVTFNYAYDAQREPDFPTLNQVVNMTNLAKPVDANGNKNTLNSDGSWTLSKVGTYSYVKDNVQAKDPLSAIVSGIAEAYNSISDPDTIVIHELKKGDDHIAYGVVAAYDTAGGYALFLGDTWTGGACYLLSMNAIIGTSTSITAGSILTDYIPAADTYGISLSQTETHTFTGATAGYGEQTALEVTVTNTGNAATGALAVTLTGDNASSFTLGDVDAGFTNGIETQNSTDTFTVKPNTGLGAGTYTATVTVSGANIVSKSFNVSFTVSAAPAPSSGGSYTPPTYKVDIQNPENANGTVSAKPGTARAGTTVTITVTPDEGYALDSLTVKDQNGKALDVTDNGDGTYTFKMPAGKVTVEASFTEIVKPVVNPFTDVEETDYFYNAVLWAVETGITEGTGDGTTFSPDADCTRAQMVTFLWRAAGSPAPKSGTMPFGDVAADTYYHDAVLWAVEQGITKGTSDSTFSPDAICTRAQIVTFLWRAEGSAAAGTANSFTDVPANTYYTNAVSWAAENDITIGTSATTFSPDADCTRAQIVTFLYRDMVK